MNVNNLTNVYNQNPSLQGQYTLQQYLDLYGSTSATPTTTATPAATPTPVQSGQSQGIINSGINQFQNGSGGLQQQGIRSYTSLQDKAAIAERKKNDPNFLDTIGKYGSKVVSKFGTLPGVSQSKGLIANIMDNTMVGRFAAMRDATNPDASNYNPNLVTQKDYALRGVDQGGLGYTQDDIGRFSGQAVDPSKEGYNPLAGLALESGWGENDLGKMLDNERTRLMGYFVKTKNLKTKARIDEIDKIIEQANIDAKIAQDAKDAKIAKSEAAARGNYTPGGSHLSRGISGGGLGLSQSQAQSVSQANKDAGYSSFSGLAKGGLIKRSYKAYGGRVGAKNGGSMIEIVKDRLMKKNPAMWGLGYEGLASLQDLIMSMPFNRGGIVNIRKR
tara:strand:+ start:102 stop:1265 length:1164 start_codon:yes stop_codon:yes gene_type:complete